MIEMACNEADLQIQVADYLRLQYPDVFFHSDFGSGAKLTPSQAMRQKRQNGGRRAWPDIEIAQPRHCFKTTVEHHGIQIGASERGDVLYYSTIYAGLFLELKKEGETLYPGPRARKRCKSKDGKKYKNEHIREQADVLYELRQRGYCAEFAIGFDEAKKIIDGYLGGGNGESKDA